MPNAVDHAGLTLPPPLKVAITPNDIVDSDDPAQKPSSIFSEQSSKITNEFDCVWICGYAELLEFYATSTYLTVESSQTGLSLRCIRTLN
jgi:hypothetical protein